MLRGLGKTPIVLYLVLALAGSRAAALELGISEGTDIALTATADGRRLIFDLYDRLWETDRSGGLARALTGPGIRLQRPDISPDGSLVVAAGGSGLEQRLWLVERDGRTRSLTPAGGRDAAPRWHPQGDRVIFSSDRAGSWDLYEVGLADGELVRITTTTTDELEPAVSPDGSLLAWITPSGTGWELWVRELDGSPTLAYITPHRLSAPSIRPDNGVVLMVEEPPAGARLTAVILSDPPVAKTLAEGEDYFRQPAVWLDKQRYLYTADGRIRSRRFGEPRWREIPFTAWISPLGPPGAEFTLEDRAPPLHHGRYVIRPGRVFDAATAGYQRGLDILVEDDSIAQITERNEWQEVPVFEYPASVAIPGLIQLGRTSGLESGDGALLLACGVTTVVSMPATVAGEAPGPAWNGGDVPGPHLVSGTTPKGELLDVRDVEEQSERLELIKRARERGAIVITDRLYPDLAVGASLLAPDASLPRSPAGRQYADIRELLAASGARLLAGGPEDESRDRVRESLEGSPLLPLLTPVRGHSAEKERDLSRACMVQRQLRRLQQSGTPPVEALRRLTRDAARLMGLDPGRGILSAGSRADILLIDGDPLRDVRDAIRVEAVVTGGRFFTPAGLVAANRGLMSENLTKSLASEEMSPKGDTSAVVIRLGPW